MGKSYAKSYGLGKLYTIDGERYQVIKTTSKTSWLRNGFGKVLIKKRTIRTI